MSFRHPAHALRDSMKASSRHLYADRFIFGRLWLPGRMMPRSPIVASLLAKRAAPAARFARACEIGRDDEFDRRFWE